MEFVNVAVRIKPSSNRGLMVNKILVVSEDPPTLYIVDRHQAYTFDKIFNHETQQAEIFDTLIHPLIEKTMSGYNSTVFAYGQTGTGKTYTIGSDMKESEGQNVGIIKRVFESIFSKISISESTEIQLSVCEIYQEKVYDLLGDNKTALTVKGVNNMNLTLQKVKDLHSAEKMLVKSCKRRHTGETKQNSWSSRSHAVFTVYVNTEDENGVRCSKLNLVDLAGCESIKKTGTQDNQFNEAIKINMGLLSVGLVITALTLNKSCIPYRQSMLTKILYDSLNKQSYITLIACISANPTDLHETIQTLDFALKTKKVKSKPKLSSILIRNNRGIPNNYSHYITMNDIKTPMKRPNPYMHTSTSIKRLKVTSASTHTQNSHIVSPITETVIDKLKRRCSENSELSTKNSEFYDTIYKLVQEEVHLRTSNLNSHNLKEKKEAKVSLHESSITNTSLVEVNLENVIDEISGIFNISCDKLELATISSNNKVENKENIGAINKNITTTCMQSTSPFKVPELPKWCSSPNSVKSRKSILNDSREKKNHVRRSVRLSVKRAGMNTLFNKGWNSESSLSMIGSTKTTKNSRNEYSNTCLIENESNLLNFDKCNANGNDNEGRDLPTNARKSTRRSTRNTESGENVSPRKLRSSLLQKNKNKQNRIQKFSLKKSNKDESFEFNDSSISRISNTSKTSEDIIDTSQEDIFDENTIKTFPVFAQRRSIRLSMKRALTSTITNDKYSLDSYKTFGSSSTSKSATKVQKVEVHKSEILRILNKGNIKELQRLHTVGAKTAEQISLFRKLNGPFKTIDDLQQILYRGKSYERFLTANCLDV